ncbi:hypothetical protein NL676_006130 [Syzygium grande]|nr:hypothetical protein NL676_006130 [Syzygium grande]
MGPEAQESTRATIPQRMRRRNIERESSVASACAMKAETRAEPSWTLAQLGRDGVLPLMRLVHTLMACAEAVQQENLKLADELVKAHWPARGFAERRDAQRLATYFAEALARRIYRIDSPTAASTTRATTSSRCTSTRPALTSNSPTSLPIRPFWEPSPPPTASTSSISASSRGRTTPTPCSRSAGGWLNSGVSLRIRWLISSLPCWGIRPPEVETVAVNSVFELLPGLLARPGAIDKVLSSIKAMRPKIVTMVEQEANHNGPVFVERFTEALHYYSGLFDSLEGSGVAPPSQDLVMSEVYLGRQICNVVACEGTDRVERHETLAQWRARMGSAGFDPVHLGSNAFEQASMLLALFAGGEGYGVEENDGCLMLGWHTRPLDRHFGVESHRHSVSQVSFS